MKKIEAIQIAPEKSKLIIEYIASILSSTERVNGQMIFGTARINSQNVLRLYTFIPGKDFKDELDLEITSEHDLILYEFLLNDLLDTFLEHETIGVSKFYSIKSMQTNFSGINAMNSSGSKIKINLNSSGTGFMNLTSNYNRKYNEYAEKIRAQEIEESKVR